MSSTLVSPKRCHDLSNELLSRIFDYFDDGRPRTYPPERRKLAAYDALLRVCRRWELVVRTHIWRSIAHPNMEDFLEQWGGGKLTSSYVRHLRIGFAGPNGATLPATPALRDLATRPEELPFPNLRILEHTESISSSKLISTLSVACPRLEKLVLYWDWFEGFPRSELLPNLRTLRLHMSYVNKPPPPPKKKKPRKRSRRSRAPRSPSPAPPPPPPPPLPLQPFNHLTTLYVHNSSTSQNPSLSTYYDISFPNLRVLRLENIRQVWRTYEFIQRHPSILEVTLEMGPGPEIYFRLESLDKLIGGTGVWRQLDDDDEAVVDQAIDANLRVQDSLDCDEGEAHTTPSAPTLYGLLRKVAFTRAALLPVSSDTDTTMPRYMCTGLALYFEEISDFDLMSPGHFGYDVMGDAVDFVRAIGKNPIFRDIEELRLGSDLFYSNGLNFEDIMDKFGTELGQLSSLRKFTLWIPTYRSFTFSGTSSTKFPTLLDTSKVLEFGSVSGDIEKLWGEPYTLADLYWFKDEDIEDFVSVVRDILGKGPDEDLDRDNIDLMPVWELYNYHHMEKIVCKLASTCRHLERFEWWALEHHNTEYRTVVWDWKIHPEKNALSRGKVKTVSGHLTWTGPDDGRDRGRDEPPREFPILLGKELERHRRFISGQSCAH